MENHHYLLDESFAVHIYSANGTMFNGQIIKFPPYQPNSHVRAGSPHCNIPTQASVEEAVIWAKNYLGIS